MGEYAEVGALQYAGHYEGCCKVVMFLVLARLPAGRQASGGVGDTITYQLELLLNEFANYFGEFFVFKVICELVLPIFGGNIYVWVDAAAFYWLAVVFAEGDGMD